MRYIQLKPTLRHATQSNGDAVIVKLVRSHELKILRHLHSSKSPYNHTIPLLGTLELNMGTFIILPEATPLYLGFALGMFRSERSRFQSPVDRGCHISS